MSIYSGFATRQQQQCYYSYVKTLIQISQKRILKFYHNQPADENKFITIIKRLFINMKKMERYKYLQPKLSEGFQQLYEYLDNENSQQVINVKQEKKQDVLEINNINQTQPLKMQLNLSKEKNLIDSYEKESQKRSESFRIKRPLTTKFSSSNRSRPQIQKISENKPNQPINREDDSIRNVLQQYLNCPGKLSKAQKHYMRAYRKHKNEMNILFNNENPKSEKSVNR